MKKLKLNFGEGGIKGFLFAHVEKIVLGVVALLVIMVVWSGTALKPIEENLTPEELARKAEEAARRQKEDHWETIRQTRFPVEDRFIEQANAGTRAVDPAAYPQVPLIKPVGRPERKRADPLIYPVEKLEVSVAYGAVAEGSKEPVGRFARAAAPEEVEDGRQIPPEIAEDLPSFRPSNPVGARGRDAPTVAIKPYYIVAVKGLVPLGKQEDEYEHVFKKSSNYLEGRDTPTYGGKENAFGPLYYVVERAEVAPDGSLGPWEVKGESWHHQWYEANKFTAGTPEEIADPQYVDDRFTSPLPPLMLRDLEPLALHSEVASATAAVSAEEEEDGADDELAPSPDLEGPFAPPEVDPLSGFGDERPPRGEGGLYRGDFGEGGTGSAPSVAEYALFRFFDVRVEPGKSYAYRVKLILEDPNDPKPVDSSETGASNPKPKDRFLEPAVIERLLRKEDPSVHWRESPYSEVSAVATVPSTNKPNLFAGAFVPGKTTYLRPSGAPVEVSEPTVKVMAVAWDAAKAMDVAGMEEVARGQPVNFQKEVEAISPKDWMLVKVNGKFQTGAVLLDMQGHAMTNKKDAEALPGKVLLLDANGQLVVRSELADKPEFSKFVYPEVEAETPVEGPILNEGEGPRGEGFNIFEGS